MFNYEKIEPIRFPFNGISIGVVEDNNDPNKAGRCKVRILGIHTPNKIKGQKDGIPTSELPWAISAVPIAEGGTSGKGMFSVPLQGSWVAIFFIGGDHNYPVYFASIASNPTKVPDTTQGFSDPAGKYPDILNEPDWNANARNSGTLIKTEKDANLETGIPQVIGTWAEPSSPYAAQYPHNTVFETHDKGIIKECDSTSGGERYHVYHKASKSYIEIGPTGSIVVKSTDNSYSINIKDKNVLVKGDLNISVRGNVDIKADADATISIGGNADINTTGNVNLTAGGSLAATATLIKLN